MPRKHRVTKTRATVWPPSLWMQQDMWSGPHPIGSQTDEEAYERHARRGFGTLGDLGAYWFENRGRLLAEYGGDVVFSWWAYKRYG